MRLRVVYLDAEFTQLYVITFVENGEPVTDQQATALVEYNCWNDANWYISRTIKERMAHSTGGTLLANALNKATEERANALIAMFTDVVKEVKPKSMMELIQEELSANASKQEFTH